MPLPALETAQHLQHELYPNAQLMILGGSSSTQQTTSTSDLDLFVLDPSQPSSHRENIIYQDWPVELFIYHTLETYYFYINKDIQRGRPALLRIVAEGQVIIQQESCAHIQPNAQSLLQTGPPPWSDLQIETARYMVTDLIDDLIGCTNPYEEIFIVQALSEELHQFLLRTNGHWIGRGKWIYRSLARWNQEFANTYSHFFQQYYLTKQKEPLIQFVLDVLKPYGGKHFEGYVVGK
ncbi:nucleotidyltransferase domain-containing protein [Baia soyae]|uniref:Nucleotidyltransferase-like protein n=1 Tax=Baia soyae TaxID=1544746 RepID=A0A4R2RJN0_9BACL|nr:nucleotidyltransferase domain-containing protein [Baia soyae]TCP64030.1 hypothetical protein EDD57_14418 [Baia soyae]